MVRGTIAACGLIAFALVTSGCGRPAPARLAAERPQASRPVSAQEVAREGGVAPDFSFTTLDGKTIELSDLKGKPVVLNFWASWCHYCLGEAPDLEVLYKKYSPQGLQMLGVGTDDPAALKRKAEELKLTYAIGSEPNAAKLYGVNGIPHTFFISRDGKIAKSLLGAAPRAELEAQIKRIL
jgi:peroxiredoxin